MLCTVMIALKGLAIPTDLAEMLSSKHLSIVAAVVIHLYLT
jgi:hypothetical protein